MNGRILAVAGLTIGLLAPPAAHAGDGVSYSPTPGFAGSTEQFDACGFQQGETIDLILDGATLATATADTGCVHITQQTALDIAPNAHNVDIKGEQSGTDQIGIYVVAPPTAVAAPTVPGGSTLVVGQFFAPVRTPMLLPTDGHIVPAPAVTDMNGGLLAQVSVLPDTPPGAYPVIIRDDPWLTNPPPLVIVVNPPPSEAAASAQPGGWTLNVTSTLTRDNGKLSVIATSTINAPFTVSNGQVNGQGQLNISVDMKGGDMSCHGDSQAPFTVGGTQAGGMLHLLLTGTSAGVPVTVTCGNGITLPFTLPAGTAPQPFDIEAADGKTVDFDGSSPFLMVPDGFSGHAHVVLTKS